MRLCPEELRKRLPAVPLTWKPRPDCCKYTFTIEERDDVPPGALWAFPIWVHTGDDNGVVQQRLEFLAPSLLWPLVTPRLYEDVMLQFIPTFFEDRRSMDLFDPQQTVAKWYWVYMMEIEVPKTILRSPDEL